MAETANTCPECEATIPPCDHFPWCPTLEVNRLATTIQILSGFIDRDALTDEDRAFVDRLTDPRRDDCLGPPSVATSGDPS